MCASSCIKQYVQPSYGCRGMPVVAGMLYCVKKLFNTYNVILKSTGTRTKNIFKNEQKSRDAAAKKHSYKRSRDK